MQPKIIEEASEVKNGEERNCFHITHGRTSGPKAFERMGMQGARPLISH